MLSGDFLIILFTSNNTASKTIANVLISQHGFIKRKENEWERDGVKLLDTQLPTVLDVPESLETDLIIMLSSHKSRIPGKMLTVHIPGNWGEAGMGGDSRTLNIANPHRLQMIAKAMKAEADRIDWPFCLEADHHGPTISIPIIFVEIGNNEEQWSDKMAATAVANAVLASLGPVTKTISAIGFGGGHYQKKLTERVISGEIAVGHMAPKYAIDSIDISMFKQALEKNTEKIDKVIILKDEVNASQKTKIKEFSKQLDVDYIEM